MLDSKIQFALNLEGYQSFSPSKPGVGNVQPAGQIRPAETFHPAREHIKKISQIILEFIIFFHNLQIFQAHFSKFKKI